MAGTAQRQGGQTCPQCYSSGLHPKAKKCRQCGSSLESRLPVKHRLVIFGIFMLGAALTIGIIVIYAHGMQDQIMCNARRAASKAC